MTDDVPVLAPGWCEPRPLASTRYDSLADLPTGWRYGGGLEHEHEPRAQTETGPDDSDSRPTPNTTPATFGEERHPSFILTPGSERGGGAFEPTGWELHRCCADDDAPRWSAALTASDLPAWVYDAETDERPVRVCVFGTREGDTWSGEVSVERIGAASGGGLVAQIQFPRGENGTLYRLAATGCLVCGGGR